jgi:NADPH:quinone reductase-like Zn-dependent oxidoreductase
MVAARNFLVDQSALRLAGFATKEVLLEIGQALLRIDRFALTANNVTYAALGEQFGYWKFFPAEPPKGRVPVWGYADVVETRSSQVAVGDRYWGYYPIGSHLVVTPSQASSRGFVDAAAHRHGLPGVYNQYERASPDHGHPRDEEGLNAVFRPLFATGFLIDDFLADNGYFGAERVLVTSASSKTALSFAQRLKARGACPAIGLTSARNSAFVAETGYFDTVIIYGDLGSLRSAGPAVLVDMAGDASLIDRLANRLGEAFVYNCMVGGAHWEAAPAATRGPPRSLFFAPDQIAKRLKDWGPAGYADRFREAWSAFAASAREWLKIVERRGEPAVGEAWRALLDGAGRPEEGLVLGL